MRWVYDRIPPATLSGYKINAGGNYTNPAYNGLAVTVSGTGTTTANPYYFNGGSGNAPAISTGSSTTVTKTVSVQTPPPGWRVIGHGICDTSASGCTATNVKLGGTFYTASTAQSFSYTFRSGRDYTMRWVFEQIPPPQCAGPNNFGGTAVVGLPIQFSASILLGAWPINPIPDMTVVVTGPGGTPVNKTYTSAQYTVSGTTITSPNDTFTPSAPGQYTLTYSTTGFWAMSCSATMNAGDQPYLQVDGGDVLSGNSGIYGYNQNNANIGGATGYAGAGAQLAVLSSGDISGFVSGKGMLAGFGGGYNLSFANTGSGVNTGGSYYGGQFNLVPLPMTIPTALTPASFDGNLSNITTSGVYSATGPLRGTLDGKNHPGLEVTVISSGDIGISGDIDYSYNDITEAPRLNVFSDGGNIIIAHGVTEMHGVLIAQSDSADVSGTGNLYTCGDAAASTGYEYNGLNGHGDECKTKLTIYGSVTASRVILGRTSRDLGARAARHSSVRTNHIQSRSMVTPQRWDYSSWWRRKWRNRRSKLRLVHKSAAGFVMHLIKSLWFYGTLGYNRR